MNINVTPAIGEEAVLLADPQVIIASGMDEARPEWLDEWRRWPRMDILQRHSTRILDGAEQALLAGGSGAECDRWPVTRPSSDRGIFTHVATV